MLTDEQRAKRAFKVTASMMPIIMNGDAEQLMRLYRETIGEIEREPSNYAMQIGAHIEAFLLDYWEKYTGQPITQRGVVADHPNIKGIACTLDGWRAYDDAVIETKFLSPFRRKEEFFNYYYPQLLMQMRIVRAKRGILLVAQGTNDPIDIEIAPEPDAYEAEMWERAKAFLLCMQTLTPPIALPPKVPPEQWRAVDVEKDMPNWGPAIIAELQLLEDTREASDLHERAGKGARTLVPADVSTVYAPAHTLRRDKRGVISIRRNNTDEPARRR